MTDEKPPADRELAYRSRLPDPSLAGYVESCWTLENGSGQDRGIVLLPDGRVDLIFARTESGPVRATLLGISTQPEPAVLEAHTRMCAVSLRLPAAEALFPKLLAELLNGAARLPDGFWEVGAPELDDFDRFCVVVYDRLSTALPTQSDSRKETLFALLYSTDGQVTIRALSERSFWSSRQINRYFTQQFGLPLKAYCSILRFRASFAHIREGKLFPQQQFADQSHFIREVKKLSGVLPKELKHNRNGRFIQFSTLPPE